jgi:hypothetical protein
MDDKGTGPAHTPGTRKGENVEEEEVEATDGGLSDDFAADDSTGINADDMKPIDPSMPNMPPP